MDRSGHHRDWHERRDRDRHDHRGFDERRRRDRRSSDREHSSSTHSSGHPRAKLVRKHRRRASSRGSSSDSDSDSDGRPRPAKRRRRLVTNGTAHVLGTSRAASSVPRRAASGASRRDAKRDGSSSAGQRHARGRQCCKFCHTVIKATDRTHLVQHLGHCRLLPPGVQAALDAKAVREAAAGVRRYANAAWRHYRVTGSHEAVCHGCGCTVRGNNAHMSRHTAACPAANKPPRVDLGALFTTFDTPCAAHGRCTHQCRRCKKHVVARSSVKFLRRHLAKCPQVEDETRTLLDQEAVWNYRCSTGVYARPVFAKFEVTAYNKARCRSCTRTVKGDAEALERHTSAQCPGAPAAPDATMRVDQYFVDAADVESGRAQLGAQFSAGQDHVCCERDPSHRTCVAASVTVMGAMRAVPGAERAERQCRWCKAVLRVGALSDAVKHLRGCDSVPPGNRTALNKAALCDAKGGRPPYTMKVQSHYRIQGLLRFQCRKCRQVVAKVRRHRTTCKGAKPTASRSATQFIKLNPAAAAGGQRATHECAHCHARVVAADNTALKQHLSHCSELPTALRAELDAEARAEWVQGEGKYLTNATFAHFNVVGLLRGQCQYCDSVIIGAGGHLQRHLNLHDRDLRPRCLMHTTEHFERVNAGSGSKPVFECKYCHASLEILNPDTRVAMLREHLGDCQRLPKAVAARRDVQAKRSARLKRGAYGSNSVFKHFDVVGWRRSVCKACKDIVSGDVPTLLAHVCDTNRAVGGDNGNEGVADVKPEVAGVAAVAGPATPGAAFNSPPRAPRPRPRTIPLQLLPAPPPVVKVKQEFGA